MPIGLAANSANLKGHDMTSGPTSESDFIEVSFDKPIEKLDYLSARTTAVGSTGIVLEVSGPGTATRRFTIEVVGDEALHNLKSPLLSKGNGFASVRTCPGKSAGFTFEGMQVCRQPEDLLK